MNDAQLKALLEMAEDAARRIPMAYMHISPHSCAELVKEVLEARRLKGPIIVADLTLDEVEPER